MDLEQLESAVSQAPEQAEAMIAELVRGGDVEGIARIVHGTHVEQLQLRAIDALAELGGGDANAILTDLLETENRRYVRGGTEQQQQHQRVRGQLLGSLARMHRIAPPRREDDEEAIAEFVSRCRATGHDPTPGG